MAPAAGSAVAPGAVLDGLGLVDQLGAAGDRAAIERAVVAIERGPAGTPNLDYALFRAGQACEDTLADPARGLALYERLVRELPDAGIAIAAGRRIELLRGQVGAGGQHAREAAELARLIAEADQLAPAELDRRARSLTEVDWSGASDAVLWHAEWLRRGKRFVEADARFAEVVARWPGTPQANDALRGGAGAANDAGDWARAEELARRIPEGDPADRVMSEELLATAAAGRRRDLWYIIAWLAVVAALAGLGASFADALRRAPPPRRVRLPSELIFLAPVAAVMIGVALTTHETIAPAVTIVSAGGLLLAGVSGATLDLLRAAGRPMRRRAVLHVGICFVAVVALLFIALVRDHLLELVIETVRFGPEL